MPTSPKFRKDGKVVYIPKSDRVSMEEEEYFSDPKNKLVAINSDKWTYGDPTHTQDAMNTFYQWGEHKRNEMLNPKNSVESPKVLGELKYGTSTHPVFDQLPKGWKAERSNDTPNGYILITNGVTPFDSRKGNRREIGFLKDPTEWELAKYKKRNIQEMK